jgi:uncharacterized protein YjiS (DUF1127 family)
MAFVTDQHPVRQRPSSGIVSRLLDMIARARLERRTFAELSDLSDRELGDLGLRRRDLREVARRAAARA